ncbi:zinc finger protein [Macleaya cordata]|uniref:Zinc finger protein n=1 Tax=Macleaya cordata TaxID=56857 RepID=A0A200Q1H4_MACCD|nr:zinc finger protein [Macleaya cordata]
MEMEENELEEGEACYYQKDNDEDNIDPDVHLSYIDEKIQVILGHFQKDFEGGVSAENLGSKFGGYGSFLPSYQRSPSILSHPRTPQKVQNYNALKSPNNLQSESTGEFTPKHKPVNKSINPTEQKTLKVRIKVGPDRMSAQTNAEIYSGLGLDISPSSSLEDSAAESGGLSLESHDAPDESPASMLRNMTSFPVLGGSLLSPLADSLLRMTEKEKLLTDSRYSLADQCNQASSAMLVDESPSVRRDRRVCGEKKKKSVEKKSLEVNNINVNDAGNGSSFLGKEISVGNPIPPNALKLPLVSKSKGDTDDRGKDAGWASDITGELNKSVVKEDFFSDFAKKETLESMEDHNVENFRKQNLKNNVADNFLEDRKTCYLKDDQLDPSKYGRSEEDKSCDPSSGRLDGSKERKDLKVGPEDPPKQKTSYEKHGLKVPHGKEKSSAGGKKKSKGSQGKDIPAEEFPKESSRVGSSSSTKYKKKSTGEYPSKNKLENKRLHKESGKTRESRIDLLGDTKMELAENGMDLLETPRHKPMDSVLQVVEKETPKFSNKAKERSSGRKVENQLKSEAYSKSAPMVTPLTGNGPVSDAVPTTVAPVVIEEHWVACDRCQKWRLLPFGTNPDNLPKKWLCSMLNWLPGMNRCSVSEEETTKALNALYLLPAPENQNSLNNLSHGAASGVTSAGVQHLDQTHQGYDLHGGFSGGRKKPKSKEAVNAAMDRYPTELSNSTKKTLLVSLKSRNLHDANQSSLESNLANGAGFQQSSEDKHSKLNRKRGANQDEFRVSKKSKISVCTDERRIFEHDRTAKAGPNSMNGISNNATGKDVHKEAKDAKYDSKDGLPVSIKKLKDKVQVSLNGGPLDIVKCDTVGIPTKKRKVKEWQESQIYQPEALPSTGHYFEDNSVSVKEMSESERRKEKKARVSKSGGKESSSSKGGDKTDKRGIVTRIHISGSKNPFPRGMGEDDSGCVEKDQQLGQYEGANTASQRSLDGIDMLKKDLGYAQHSVTAASSSSKVSGSRKSRINIQEVKGSPVESVSSSPLRIANPDKVIPARRKLLGKDNATNVRYSVMGTPRRCSDGEVDGGNVASENERAEGAFPRSSLVACAHDHHDSDANHRSGGKFKAQIQPYNPMLNDSADASDQHKPYLGELLAGEPGNDERVNNNLYSSNGSQLQKSVKGSSLRSKDKHRSSKSAYGEGDKSVFGSFSEQEWSQTKNLRHETEIGSQNLSYNEEPRGEKNSFQEKCGAKSNKVEKNDSGKKDSLSEGRRERRSKFGEHEGSDVKLSGTCSKDGKSSSKQKLLQIRESEEPSNKFVSDRIDHLETAPKKGKSKSLSYSGDKQEILAHPHRPTAGKLKGSGSDILPVDASGCIPMKLDNQNGAYHSSSRQSTSSGLLVRNLESQSPVRKDSSSQAAANAFKEAKVLKHTADRLKNTGQELESTGIYFQAALKFLQGASFLELCNNDSIKHGEMPYMIEMYSSTAKLCEFVAREYERFKKMAAAALAYKCMEVAYMKVIYSKNSTVSKDRHELQTALQMVPPGESPSSSSSDVDNLNNQGTLDKVVLAKNVSSPQITGNHVIVARNHPNFVRLLNFAQNVNFAMEASRKSQNALAAANAGPEDAEGIASVKTVIDFTFHDVDGLLRLVRLAIEAVSR